MKNKIITIAASLAIIVATGVSVGLLTKEKQVTNNKETQPVLAETQPEQIVEETQTDTTQTAETVKVETETVTETQPAVEPAPQPAPQAYVVADYKKNLFMIANIPEAEWESADKLIQELSGWCQYKNTHEQGCPTIYVPRDSTEPFGLCLLPYNTAHRYGISSPPAHTTTQIQACNAYVKQTYGNWNNAYNQWAR